MSTVAGLQIRFGQQVRMTGLLVGQRVGERVADGAILVADQHVDVSDLVAIAHQGFADVHGH
jgi:hypothetical protein